MPAKSQNRKGGKRKKEQWTPRKICCDCDSAFMTSRDLLRHVCSHHTHEKPYHCKECNYASVELSKLKLHMRTHTGEKPYQCSHCSHATSHMFLLKRHMLIHTGEKPYKCDECQRRFNQSTTLKNHKLHMHSENRPSFPCEICLKPLARLRELKLHMERMHNDKRHGETSSAGHSSHEVSSGRGRNKETISKRSCHDNTLSEQKVSEDKSKSYITNGGIDKITLNQCLDSFTEKRVLRVMLTRLDDVKICEKTQLSGSNETNVATDNDGRFLKRTRKVSLPVNDASKVSSDRKHNKCKKIQENCHDNNMSEQKVIGTSSSQVPNITNGGKKRARKDSTGKQVVRGKLRTVDSVKNCEKTKVMRSNQANVTVGNEDRFPRRSRKLAEMVDNPKKRNRILQSAKTTTVKKEKDLHSVDIPTTPIRASGRKMPLTSTPEILRIKSIKTEDIETPRYMNPRSPEIIIPDFRVTSP